jgi:hypothetical protein
VRKKGMQVGRKEGAQSLTATRASAAAAPSTFNELPCTNSPTPSPPTYLDERWEREDSHRWSCCKTLHAKRDRNSKNVTLTAQAIGGVAAKLCTRNETETLEECYSYSTSFRTEPLRSNADAIAITPSSLMELYPKLISASTDTTIGAAWTDERRGTWRWRRRGTRKNDHRERWIRRARKQ